MTIKGIKNQIKYAWQRLYRGYDDKVLDGWGLEDYFIQILPSLREFCQRELDDVIDFDFNRERNEILKETIRLIDEKELEEYTLNDYREVFEYIAKNVGNYWS